jgi:FkbM family methyltransferase
MPRWQVWLGQARCTRDALLRQAIYWWLGRKAGNAESDRSRRGILHWLGRMRWTHHAARWLGAYTLANALLQAFPMRRTLPHSGCRVRIRSVAGLALAEEMLAGQAYAVLKKLGTVQTFIDLGSNTGWFPCLLREYGCSPHPVGLLIDADPAMVEESRWHMAANCIDAECLCGAVGVAAASDDGTTRFHVNPANTSSSLTPFGADHPFPVKGRVRTISVQTVQVADAWRQRHGDLPVSVLKVDVEGAEFDFFRFEGDFVAATVRAIVCEWHAWHGSLDDLTALVEPLGFRLLEVGQQDAHGGVATFVSSRALS